MSEKEKPPTKPMPHMEKQVMDEPQEEFVADQSVPSESISPPPPPPKAAKDGG